MTLQILLLCFIGFIAFAILLGLSGGYLVDHGYPRTGIAVLNAALSLAPALAPIAMAALFLMIFWTAEALGIWESPTPENIRKLDLQMARDK